MAAKKKNSSKKKSKKTQSKADFVRSLPTDMPAKEVVAKAAEAQVAISEDYVYKTRSLDSKRAGSANGASAKSGTAKVRGRAPNKKNHVLELVAANPSWTAEQVAKAVGCSSAYVYGLWRGKKSAGKSHKKNVSASSSNNAVTDFYRVLKRVGVEKARELIANIEAFQNA